MQTETQLTKQNLTKPYMWLVIVTGTLACISSAYHLKLSTLDLRFAGLAFVALFLSSRIVVQIPRFKSVISVSDTFVFLILLIYGAEIAVLVAATEAFLSTLRFSKKWITVWFNFGSCAFSTFLTAHLLYLLFGDVLALRKGELSAAFFLSICVMAMVQYVVNSGVVAIAGALKNDQPIWQTWKTHYLWTSITYLAGASAAGLIAKLMGLVGFYVILVTAPIIAIVFFTYRTYLKNVESSAAQAEQAERHVQELSHYIAEQERIREQFSQIEKLSALGELASGVAHDFNNTLAGILGRAQLLLRTNDPERIMHGLNIIIKTAEDGAKTVKRIQDFARQRRDYDFELVSVEQILFDVSEMTRPLWKDKAESRNIQITLDLVSDSHARIMGDQSELREVLINMIFNAVDAMPKGGTLSLGAVDDGDIVTISVGDTGIGMSPEVRSRIFDPFFTTKGTAGMGLGLAVGFGIIRRHEGTVEVDSTINQGTTFRVMLPVARVAVQELAAVQPALEARVEPEPLSFPRNNRTRILVVDDEEHVRDLIRDVLEAEGCTVYLAGGGREALALFDECDFDGVLTDVGMPGMNGWELSSAIRTRNSEIPIAVITGWGEAVGSNEQKEAGVNWVVSKPFTVDRIVELAEEITEQRSVVGNHGFAEIAA
jgi:signal transduction histidine kinase/ActR/RegA family two-component response regulator